MPITQYELEDRLRREDEITLLELLDISSEELVNRFKDRIEYRFDQLAEEFGDDYENEEENPFWERE